MCGHPSRLECLLELPDACPRSSRREGLLINHRTGTDGVSTNILQATACSHPLTVVLVHLGWGWHTDLSFVAFFYFIRYFWKTMYFLSSDWKFVLVCTGSREAYFFFMVIGSRCKPFAFTSESLSGVCMAVNIVCLTWSGHICVLFYFS